MCIRHYKILPDRSSRSHICIWSVYTTSAIATRTRANIQPRRRAAPQKVAEAGNICTGPVKFCLLATPPNWLFPLNPVGEARDDHVPRRHGQREESEHAAEREHAPEQPQGDDARSTRRQCRGGCVGGRRRGRLGLHGHNLRGKTATLTGSSHSVFGFMIETNLDDSSHKNRCCTQWHLPSPRLTCMAILCTTGATFSSSSASISRWNWRYAGVAMKARRTAASQ